MSSLLLQHCPAYFICLIWIVLEICQCPCLCSIDITVAWKKFRFILSDRSDFYTIDSLSIAVYAFARRIVMSLSVDETLLLRYGNLSTNFRELPFRVEMSLSWLQHMYSVLSAFTWRPMPPAAYSRLCSRYSAWVGVFARSAMSSV